jgi:hypothetical protein
MHFNYSLQVFSPTHAWPIPRNQQAVAFSPLVPEKTAYHRKVQAPDSEGAKHIFGRDTSTKELHGAIGRRYNYPSGLSDITVCQILRADLNRFCSAREFCAYTQWLVANG